MSRTTLVRGLSAVALLGGLAVALALLPVGRWLASPIRWIQGLGPAGALTFAALYVVGALLLVPGSLLTLAAGLLYGPCWGALLVIPSSVVGAAAAFLLARTVARGAVVRALGRRRRLRALDEALGEGGVRNVALLRLSPLLPYSLMNYALGVTRVGLRAAIVGSAIGMLPGTLFYVYLGSTLGSVASLSQGPPRGGRGGVALLGAGLIATGVATWLVGRSARRRLRGSAPRTP